VLNYTTLSKTFEISDKTIKEYINYFEDVFLLNRIDKFHNKQKERIKSTKKIYVLDNGFLQITPSNSKNLGKLLENMVFTILNQTCDDLTYLKESKEIDFKCGNHLYQVSYDMRDEKTRKREIDAFKFLDKEDRYKHQIITYDENKDENGVGIISFEEFSLSLPQ